jgi:hypothetical protein
VLEGEGLRKEILSKTHHSPYTVHPRSTKMYKDEKRAKLDFSAKRWMVSQSGLTISWRTCHGLACWTLEVVVPTFHQVRYRRLLDCHLTKHFMELSVSRPCIGTTLEGDNVGA